MSRTVEAFGRTWKHQQFYGLVRALNDNGYEVMLAPCIDLGPGYGYSCSIDGVEYMNEETPWLALCEAVEAMEEEK